MQYADARNQIEDGDLVAVMGRRGLLAWLTRFFTRDPHTHTGLAVWIDGGLYLAEINGGHNHLVPMSQLEEVDFDVYLPPVDRVPLRDGIFAALRVRESYGAPALVVIGLMNWLRIKAFLHVRRFIVCTGFCVRIFEKAGWSEHTYILSPKELTQLLKLKLSVRPGGR